MSLEEKNKRYYDGFIGIGPVILSTCFVWMLVTWIFFWVWMLVTWIFLGDATDSPSALRFWVYLVALVFSFRLSLWFLNRPFHRERRAKVRDEERRARDEERRARDEERRARDEERRARDKERRARDKERHVAAAKLRRAKAKARKELPKRNFEDVPARIPRDADDFETVCAEWMKKAGFSNVERTPKGPDGGIDTIASDAVGQAKFQPSQKVTGESVRALVGSKVERKKKRALFFHYGLGYTPDAIEAARSTGVELYQLDVDKRRFKRIDK